MNPQRIGLLILIGSAFIGGCDQEQAAQPSFLGDATVGTVDGMPVYASLFELYATARLQKDVDALTDQEHDTLLDELIRFHLLASVADRQGLTQEQAVAAQLEMQRLQSIARLMVSRHLDDNPITDAEIRLAYEQHLPNISGMQYKARHILVTEETEAIQLIEELQQGADFQDLARSRSTGPTGPDGGDLGWFSAETMVPPFAEAVTNMEVGSFSAEPVLTRFGWHVILLEDAEDRQPPGIEAVRADLTNVVQQQKIEEFVNSLSDEAVIALDNRSSD